MTVRRALVLARVRGGEIVYTFPRRVRILSRFQCRDWRGLTRAERRHLEAMARRMVPGLTDTGPFVDKVWDFT